MIPDVKQEILLITEVGSEEEIVTRLSRVGYDFTIGYLENGIQAWKNANKEVDQFERNTADYFAKSINENEDMPVFDVRKKSEYGSEHLVGAVNVPLNEINTNLASFPKEKPFTIYCAVGYRNTIAASILKQRGWDDFKLQNDQTR